MERGMLPQSMMRSLLLTLLVVVGCAKSKTTDPLGDADVDADDLADTGRTGREAGPGDGAILFDVFIDPGCDAGVDAGPITMYECDPLVEDSCGPGLGCYASAQPPTTRCGREVYVAFCAAPGPGRQGDDCLGHNDCGIGHLCVVTGAGTQCTEACDPGGGEPGCPRGFICRSTDVPGYGACF